MPQMEANYFLSCGWFREMARSGEYLEVRSHCYQQGKISIYRRTYHARAANQCACRTDSNTKARISETETFRKDPSRRAGELLKGAQDNAEKEERHVPPRVPSPLSNCRSRFSSVVGWSIHPGDVDYVFAPDFVAWQGSA
jgi:hypothetical protein